MRKLIVVCMVFGLLALSAVASSCSVNKTDDEVIRAKTLEIINNLESGNKEEIKNLFAKTKIAEIADFDNSIERLIDYYDGSYQSEKSYPNGKFRDKHGDFSTTWFIPSIDVITSTETYRLTYYYCSEYTTDKDSIGIWSLYIIKMKDDTTPEYAYGGDGLWTPGINIGKVYDEN